MSSPCYICGTGMEEIRLDARDMKPRPCTHCENVIAETVGGRGDDQEVMTWGDYALGLYDNLEEGPPIDPETGVGNP